jgi:hypothetical protein
MRQPACKTQPIPHSTNFHPEDGSYTYLSHACIYLQDYTAPKSRMPQAEQSSQRERHSLIPADKLFYPEDEDGMFP